MFFSFFFSLRGQIFGVFFAPFPEEEISDYIAHGPIIRVLTVVSDHCGSKKRKEKLQQIPISKERRKDSFATEL